MADTCKSHSGVCADLEHLQESNKQQWEEINKMRGYLIATLTGTVMTLVAAVANLLLRK